MTAALACQACEQQQRKQLPQALAELPSRQIRLLPVDTLQAKGIFVDVVCVPVEIGYYPPPTFALQALGIVIGQVSSCQHGCQTADRLQAHNTCCVI